MRCRRFALSVIFSFVFILSAAGAGPKKSKNPAPVAPDTVAGGANSAPAFDTKNYLIGAEVVGKEGLIRHFMRVRADHAARAVENDVYFVRGNNVVLGKDPAITKYDGVGYGDSYVVDPYGEVVVRSRRHREDFLFADVDPAVTDRAWKVGRSLWGLRELHRQLLDAAGIKG